MYICEINDFPLAVRRQLRKNCSSFHLLEKHEEAHRELVREHSRKSLQKL